LHCIAGASSSATFSASSSMKRWIGSKIRSFCDGHYDGLRALGVREHHVGQYAPVVRVNLNLDLTGTAPAWLAARLG
jgi:hypothetical protein